jgi:hypothetical protein
MGSVGEPKFGGTSLLQLFFGLINTVITPEQPNTKRFVKQK